MVRLRVVFSVLCTILLLEGCLESVVRPSGSDSDPKRFLKVDGTLVRNESGKGAAVQLCGTNLGGWLLREGWMDPIGKDSNSSAAFMDDYGSRTIMMERFGDEVTNDLLLYYQKKYIQTSDLDKIASLGLNFVRVPIFWEVILDRNGELRNTAFDRLDWLVKECNKRNLYVLLDLHGAPGGHSDGYQTGGHLGSNKLWTDSECLEWTIKIWETIATHYKGNSTVMGYDLLNEPVASKDSRFTVASMYDILYQAVRAVDPDHIVVMGAFYNMDYLCDPAEYGWTNVIYQTHHYMSDNRDDEAKQRKFMQDQLNYILYYRDKWHLPVYAGEYSFWCHPAVWRDWMNALSRNNILWSNWAYKNIDTDPVNWWAIYNGNTYPRPDVRKDSVEDFKAKWDMFDSFCYDYNDGLADVIAFCASSIQN